MYWSMYQADEMESTGVGKTNDCGSSTWTYTGNLTFTFLEWLLKLKINKTHYKLCITKLLSPELFSSYPLGEKADYSLEEFETLIYTKLQNTS